MLLHCAYSSQGVKGQDAMGAAISVIRQLLQQCCAPVRSPKILIGTPWDAHGYQGITAEKLTSPRIHDGMNWIQMPEMFILS